MELAESDADGCGSGPRLTGFFRFIRTTLLSQLIFRAKWPRLHGASEPIAYRLPYRLLGTTPCGSTSRTFLPWTLGDTAVYNRFIYIARVRISTCCRWHALSIHGI